MKSLFKVVSLSIILINLSLVLVSGLYAGTLTVNSGWSLKGAPSDISINDIQNNSSCVKAIWQYDSSAGWLLYHRDIDVSQYSYGQINTISLGSGFWVLGDGSCDISYATTTSSGSSLTPNPFNGKMIFTKDSNDNQEIIYFGENYAIVDGNLTGTPYRYMGTYKYTSESGKDINITFENVSNDNIYDGTKATGGGHTGDYISVTYNDNNTTSINYKNGSPSTYSGIMEYGQGTIEAELTMMTLNYAQFSLYGDYTLPIKNEYGLIQMGTFYNVDINPNSLSRNALTFVNRGDAHQDDVNGTISWVDYDADTTNDTWVETDDGNDTWSIGDYGVITITTSDPGCSGTIKMYIHSNSGNTYDDPIKYVSLESKTCDDGRSYKSNKFYAPNKNTSDVPSNYTK